MAQCACMHTNTITNKLFCDTFKNNSREIRLCLQEPWRQNMESCRVGTLGKCTRETICGLSPENSCMVGHYPIDKNREQGPPRD